jgi:hypothetical protein
MKVSDVPLLVQVGKESAAAVFKTILLETLWSFAIFSEYYNTPASSFPLLDSTELY